MAGHSHASNVKHRKNAQDSKRAKMWTKLLRLVYVAAKKGGDINMNATLRSAYNEARSAGVLLDKIEAAITRATSPHAEGEHMEEIRYNATFAGISIIVECLTDNRNRTIGELRTVFGKHGGSIAENGSIEFMFKHLGLIVFDKKIGSFEKVFEVAVGSGALDIEEGSDEYYIETEPEVLHHVGTEMIAQFGEYISSKLVWKPILYATEASPETTAKLEKIIDMLEDIDDVQNIYHNAPHQG